MPTEQPFLMPEEDISVLSRAPIREAILQIRFRPLDNFDIETVKEIEGLLPDHFDSFEEAREIQVGFKIDENLATPVEERIETVDGYRARSEEHGCTALFRRQDFLFSKMAPYTNWADFKQRAEGLWQMYKEFLPEVEFTRASLRYINELQFELPEEGAFEFADYLETTLELPEALGSHIDNFFNRIVVPFPEQKAFVVAIQSFDRPADMSDTSIKIILDNDIFRTTLNDFSESDLWECFETLRLIKDTVFFGCLTDKSKEQFK